MMSLKRETSENKLRTELAEHQPQLSLGQLAKQIEQGIKDRQAKRGSGFTKASDVLKDKKNLKDSKESSPPRLSSRRGFALKRSPSRQTSLTSFFPKDNKKAKSSSKDHQLSESESDCEIIDGDVKGGRMMGAQINDAGAVAVEDNLCSDESLYDAEENQEFGMEEYSLSDLEKEEEEEDMETEKDEEGRNKGEVIQETQVPTQDIINRLRDIKNKNEEVSRNPEETSAMQIRTTSVKNESNDTIRMKNSGGVEDVTDNELFIKEETVPSSSGCKVEVKQEVEDKKSSSCEAKDVLDFHKCRGEVLKDEVQDKETSSTEDASVSSSSKCKVKITKTDDGETLLRTDDLVLSSSNCKVGMEKEKHSGMLCLTGEGSEMKSNKYKAIQDSETKHRKQPVREKSNELYYTTAVERETCSSIDGNAKLINDSHKESSCMSRGKHKSCQSNNRMDYVMLQNSCDKNRELAEKSTKRTDKRQRRSSSSRLKDDDHTADCEDPDSEPLNKKIKLSDSSISKQTIANPDKKSNEITNQQKMSHSSDSGRSGKSHVHKRCESYLPEYTNCIKSSSIADDNLKQSSKHSCKDFKRNDQRSRQELEKSGTAPGKVTEGNKKERRPSTDSEKKLEKSMAVKETLKHSDKKCIKYEVIDNTNKSSRDSRCKENEYDVDLKHSKTVLMKHKEAGSFNSINNTPRESVSSKSYPLKRSNTSSSPEAREKGKPVHKGTSNREKQQVADWVVKYLMPHYKRNAIHSKDIFKALARQLSHNVVVVQHAQATGKRERENHYLVQEAKVLIGHLAGIVQFPNQGPRIVSAT